MDGERNERSQRERVLRERSRRSSIASLLHGRANAEEDEPEEFTPTYDDEESNEVDPTNLKENLSEADMYFYSQMVATGPPQADPDTSQAHLGSTTTPQPATAMGGDGNGTALALEALVQHLIKKDDRAVVRSKNLSQRDVTHILLAIPPVVVDDHVLTGPKLLAWFNDIPTYCEDSFWTSSFAFNATKSLFKDVPELQATWVSTTQGNTQVEELKRRHKWREAWVIVAACIVAAHSGDRHMALRKRVKAPQHLLQTGSTLNGDLCK